MNKLEFSFLNGVPSLIILCDMISLLAIESRFSEFYIFDDASISLALALGKSGCRGFKKTRDSHFSTRIQTLILESPASEWCSALLEERLHISGATLRRRLAEENTSMRVLLRETRLNYSMILLQTTRKPIKLVARECGYKSASCFTRNFISHFGIEPSAVKAQ
ncbi:helix-turn-helix domain-containing protein [Vibrio spartinae]|uniref:M5 polypeptide n=1 Tax=Vibrio spartinae TaxID=1918945 RepID=A0ABX6R2M5_9VIBR|nr:AraC family transcriptional regulator [Vibrio spartinae]QMV15684.1 M5 polypeptide [Vibrio spartinae]